MKRIILICMLMTVSVLDAQVIIGNKITESNNQALLEINTPNGAILIPKLGLNNTNNSEPLNNHVEGMFVYNISSLIDKGPYYNDGSQWINMIKNDNTNKNTIGDIKSLLVKDDHDGWYKLDGRNINNLPSAEAIKNAKKMGFNTNLPDARGTFIRGDFNNPNLGARSGNSFFKINKDNLPIININGRTFEDGLHSHKTGTDGNRNYKYDRGNVFSSSCPTYMFPNCAYVLVAKESKSTTEKVDLDNNGAHTHTFSGSFGINNNQKIELNLDNLSVNYFIYLGN